jgi:hypothetical protein
VKATAPSQAIRVIKVADEVWIATALLHREFPQRADFSVEEIVERAAREGIAAISRPGVYVHAVQHCVANRPPNPGRYRMLFETARSRRRLFRKGDPYNSAREGSKITPAADEIPNDYEMLLMWYQDWSRTENDAEQKSDLLLALAGSGNQLWANERGDEFVRRLREGWE